MQLANKWIPSKRKEAKTNNNSNREAKSSNRVNQGGEKTNNRGLPRKTCKLASPARKISQNCISAFTVQALCAIDAGTSTVLAALRS